MYTGEKQLRAIFTYLHINSKQEHAEKNCSNYSYMPNMEPTECVRAQASVTFPDMIISTLKATYVVYSQMNTEVVNIPSPNDLA